MRIRGNNQNFFRLLKKPHRSLMNSIIRSLLVWFLDILTSKGMVSLKHY
jgi:hypothetical protein